MLLRMVNNMLSYPKERCYTATETNIQKLLQSFKKNALQNTVYQDKVYEAGCYSCGFEHTITKVSFPSRYQLIDLGIGMSLWHKLTKENLSKLYSKYGLNYKSQMKSK